MTNAIVDRKFPEMGEIQISLDMAKIGYADSLGATTSKNPACDTLRAAVIWLKVAEEAVNREAVAETEAGRASEVVLNDIHAAAKEIAGILVEAADHGELKGIATQLQVDEFVDNVSLMLPPETQEILRQSIQFHQLRFAAAPSEHQLT